MKLGHTEYIIEKYGDKYHVISKVWNNGMFNVPQWHHNFVAEKDTLKEANEIIKKLVNL